MFSTFILKLSFFTSLIVICGAPNIFSTFAVIFFVFPLSLVILNVYAPFLFTVYTFSVALVSVIVASSGASIPVIVPSVTLAVTFISTVLPSNTYPVWTSALPFILTPVTGPFIVTLRFESIVYS